MAAATAKPAPKLTEVGKDAVPEVALPTPEVVAVGTARVQKLVDESALGARKMMESNMEQANKTAESFFKVAEEAAEFGRGNVEALTKATQVYVAGVQDLGRQTFALMQGLTDHALEGAKALSAVKSLQEAAQIQTNYTRSAIEKSVAESAKLGESALKLAEQSFAPLSARVTLAVEKFSRPLAA